MARAGECCLLMEIHFVNCLWVQQGGKPVERRAGNKMDLSARGIRGALAHKRAGWCWEQGLHKIVQEQIQTELIRILYLLISITSVTGLRAEYVLESYSSDFLS